MLFCPVENVHARKFSQISAAARMAAVLDGLAIAFGEKARHTSRFIGERAANEILGS